MMPVGEVATAMHALALRREVAIAVEAEDHLHALDLDRDHVAALDVADLGDGVPGHGRTLM